METAPTILTDMLSRFERPGQILSAMTDSILDQWTQQPRLVCLLHCLDQLATTIGDKDQQQWILACCRDFRLQAETDFNTLNLHPREMWTKLKKLKFGGMELLKLCRKDLLQRLTRLIIASTIYSAEFEQLSPEFENQPPSTTIEHLNVLFATLEKRPELQAILQQQDSAGLWTELETRLASRPQITSPPGEYMGSASPSY